MNASWSLTSVADYGHLAHSCVMLLAKTWLDDIRCCRSLTVEYTVSVTAFDWSGRIASALCACAAHTCCAREKEVEFYIHADTISPGNQLHWYQIVTTPKNSQKHINKRQAKLIRDRVLAKVLGSRMLKLIKSSVKWKQLWFTYCEKWQDYLQYTNNKLYYYN